MRDCACIWQQPVAVVLPHTFLYFSGEWCWRTHASSYRAVCWNELLSPTLPHTLYLVLEVSTAVPSLCISSGRSAFSSGAHPTSHPGAGQLGHQCRTEMGFWAPGRVTGSHQGVDGTVRAGGVLRVLTCYCYFELTLLIYCTNFLSKLSFMFLITDESV